uniref:Uncharacterized protein n=1 Tax=Erpetoichthys calabaricus TaxID=27687 RepID=A0A8C4RL98_ERPCA
MATGSVNPFNVSDSDEEAEQQQNVVDTEHGSSSDGAVGPQSGPISPQTDTAPATLLCGSSRTSPSGEAVSVAAAISLEARVPIDLIAAQLLRDQYVLTALEFHTELLEAGRELPRLRDYFSNPGNFERQSGTPPASKEQGQVLGVLYHLCQLFFFFCFFLILFFMSIMLELLGLYHFNFGSSCFTFNSFFNFAFIDNCV